MNCSWNSVEPEAMQFQDDGHPARRYFEVMAHLLMKCHIPPDVDVDFHVSKFQSFHPWILQLHSAPSKKFFLIIKLILFFWHVWCHTRTNKAEQQLSEKMEIKASSSSDSPSCIPILFPYCWFEDSFKLSKSQGKYINVCSMLILL